MQNVIWNRDWFLSFNGGQNSYLYDNVNHWIYYLIPEYLLYIFLNNETKMIFYKIYPYVDKIYTLGLLYS